MLEKELQDIADKAKMIVSGYAFSERDDGLISILNPLFVKVVVSDFWFFDESFSYYCCSA